MNHGVESDERRGDYQRAMRRVTWLSYGVSALITMAPAAMAAQVRGAVLSLDGTVASFGVEAGDPAQEIGKIGDVAYDGKGASFVLDVTMGRLFVVSSNGTLITTFGRSGAGPGEFLNAVALAYDVRNRVLYVLDPPSGRVTLLGWRRGTLAYRGVIRVPPLASDLCVLGDHLVLYVPSDRPGPNLQLLDSTGKVLREFGTPFGDAEGPGVRMMSRGGYLTCINENATIIVAGGGGEVHAHTSDGRSLWQARIEGFREIVAVATARGARIDWEKTRQPADVIDNTFLLVDKGLLAVQTTRRDTSKPLGATASTRETFYVDLSSGRTAGRQDNLPQISSVHGGRAYVYDDMPFPRFRVLRVTPEVER